MVDFVGSEDGSRIKRTEGQANERVYKWRLREGHLIEGELPQRR